VLIDVIGPLSFLLRTITVAGCQAAKFDPVAVFALARLDVQVTTSRASVMIEKFAGGRATESGTPGDR
jgi:hypothetical protein